MEEHNANLPVSMRHAGTTLTAAARSLFLCTAITSLSRFRFLQTSKNPNSLVNGWRQRWLSLAQQCSGRERCKILLFDGTASRF